MLRQSGRILAMTADRREISDAELTSAVELLHRIIPTDEIEAFSLRHSPATVYTTLATLWMLTLQRLGGGQSLEAIVKETLTHHRDIFPDNKRVREGTLSRNSSADSETRHRLPIEVVERFTDSVARTIIDSCPDTLKESSRCRLVWKPSAKDRKTNPALPRDARVTVELHAVQLENGEWLNLVTSLDLESEQAARLYARRYDVKHDIRDLKVSLGVENTRAQSDEMVRREMLCSMVAYNLVVQLRREAAKVARLPPRRLSFTGVWNTMQSCLLHQSQCDASTWQERYASGRNSAGSVRFWRLGVVWSVRV